MRSLSPRNLMLLLVVPLALLAIACGSEDPVDTAGPDDTTGPDDITRPSLAGRWILTGLEIDGSAVTIPADADVEMEIELGRIGGSGGCNQFGGSIDAGDDGSLTIADLAWTEMACMPLDVMDFESTYLTALSGATGWSADPTGITFTSESAALRYEPGAAPVHLDLEGTSWTLDTIFSGEGVERAASTTDRSIPDAVVVFGDQRATITTEGCEPIDIAVSYEPGRDGNMNVPDVVDLGTLGCDSANVLTAAKGLTETSGFMIDERRLTLIGLPGELIGFVGS